jgi:D-alanyl-D-alanine carboxypeptidase
MSTSSSLLPSNLTQILQTTLDTTRKQTVGVVAGLVSEQGEWFSTSGVRNLATNSPLTASDRFQIGSITKTFVATTVLQLVESGVLKLDDTLSKWLPSTLVGRIPFSNEIKISQLLNHTSGIFNYVDIIFDQGTSLFNTWTTEELIAFTYDRPPYFTPGTSWTYSNTNYVLLGEIVEAATGMNLSQVIRERILNPLGMNNTFFATEENVSGVVNGYWDIDGDGRLNDVSFLNLSWAGASGNMVSNAQDLAHFAEALFGGKLLQPTTLQQMLTLVDTPNSNTFNGYGFGIARLRNVEGVVYGHNGLTLGYRANLWYSPEESLTYVDLQNTRVFTNFVAPILTSFRAEQSGSIPEISFTLTPNQLNEAEGTVLTFNFKVDGKIPPKGLTVKLNGDAPNTLLELLAGEIEFESPTETEFEFIPENLQIKGGTLGLVDPDFSSFTFTITEANASISFKVFDDIFEEGTESFTYALAVQGDNYTINRLANSATFTITDGVPGGVVPKVGMTANQTALYEDEGTVITLTFKVDGEIPADGLIVFVDSTQGYGSIGALGQFDVFNVTTSGLSIVGTDEDASGIYLKITRPTASLSVPIFVDDSIEGSIPYTFTLINGERYEVKSDAQAVNLIIGDSAPFNIINGKSTDDVLRGTEGKDAIYAMAGYDSLYGMGGNDVLIGGADGDLIFGGDGNDLLVGNTGDDVLFGGAGLDIFAFKKGDGTDIISDFKVGEDKIGVIKGEIKPEDILFTQVGGLAVAKVKSTGETLAYLQGVDVSKLNASSVVEVTNQPIIPNNTYAPTILVANRQEYNPQIYDPTFALGWGLAIRPAGFGGHFWVTANGSGASYQYVGDVNIGKPNAVPLYQDDLALVTVPGSNNTQGTPTGVVFNGSNNFVITQPYAGGNITGPSRFFFATDSGTISTLSRDTCKNLQDGLKSFTVSMFQRFRVVG